MSKLLIDDYPLMVLPQLAEQIGLNKAIVLQQIHYWINKNKPMPDGYTWVYNSIPEWKKQFPFWSEKTIANILRELRSEGFLVAESKSENHWDKTLFYRINHDALESCIRKDLPDQSGKVCLNTIYTETNAETIVVNTLIPKKQDSKFKVTADRPNEISEELWIEFIDHRKSRRASITPRVIDAFKREAKNAGFSLSKAIEKCIERNWTSFEADWVLNKSTQTKQPEALKGWK